MKKKSLVGWTAKDWWCGFRPMKKLARIFLGGYINDKFRVPPIYPLKKDWSGAVIPPIKVRITIEQIK